MLGPLIRSFVKLLLFLVRDIVFGIVDTIRTAGEQMWYALTYRRTYCRKCGDFLGYVYWRGHQDWACSTCADPAFFDTHPDGQPQPITKSQYSEHWMPLGIVALLAMSMFVGTASAVRAQELGPPAPEVVVIEDGQLPDAVEEAVPIEYWEIIVSTIIVPLVVTILKRRGMSQEAKRGLMVFTAAVIGVFGSFLRGELDDFQYTTAAILKIIVMTQAIYTSLGKMPGIGDALTRLDRATQGKPTP